MSRVLEYCWVLAICCLLLGAAEDPEGEKDYECSSYEFTGVCATMGNITKISYAHGVGNQTLKDYMESALDKAEEFALSNFALFAANRTEEVRNSTICKGAFVQLHCLTINNLLAPLCRSNASWGLLPCFGTCVNFQMGCFGQDLKNASMVCADTSAPEGAEECEGTPEPWM